MCVATQQSLNHLLPWSTSLSFLQVLYTLNSEAALNPRRPSPFTSSAVALFSIMYPLHFRGRFFVNPSGNWRHVQAKVFAFSYNSCYFMLTIQLWFSSLSVLSYYRIITKHDSKTPLFVRQWKSTTKKKYYPG